MCTLPDLTTETDPPFIMPSDKPVGFPLSRHTSSLFADPTDSTKVRYWIERPIHVGFLKSFSLGEHNSENISFIMEISGLKDHMDVDMYAWSLCKPWQVVDKTLNIDAQIEEEEGKSGDAEDTTATLRCEEVVCSMAGWPATKLPKSQLVKHVQEIWDTYFSSTATFEICISMEMRRRVVFRLKRLHLYGKEAFDEAMIDPMKTVAKVCQAPFYLSTHLSRPLYRPLSRSLPWPYLTSPIYPSRTSYRASPTARTSAT